MFLLNSWMHGQGCSPVAENTGDVNEGWRRYEERVPSRLPPFVAGETVPRVRANTPGVGPPSRIFEAVCKLGCHAESGPVNGCEGTSVWPATCGSVFRGESDRRPRLRRVIMFGRLQRIVSDGGLLARRTIDCSR